MLKNVQPKMEPRRRKLSGGAKRRMTICEASATPRAEPHPTSNGNRKRVCLNPNPKPNDDDVTHTAPGAF